MISDSSVKTLLTPGLTLHLVPGGFVPGPQMAALFLFDSCLLLEVATLYPGLIIHFHPVGLQRPCRPQLPTAFCSKTSCCPYSSAS